MKSPSRVQLFATPWTAAHQAPPSMGFSRQEWWSGMPLPSPKIHSMKLQLLFCTNLIPTITITATQIHLSNNSSFVLHKIPPEDVVRSIWYEELETLMCSRVHVITVECLFFMFGCTGSLLVHTGFLYRAGPNFLFWCTGFLLLTWALGQVGSVVVACRFSCGSAGCGIFLDQGSKPCPLHW